MKEARVCFSEMELIQTGGCLVKTGKCLNQKMCQKTPKKQVSLGTQGEGGGCRAGRQTLFVVVCFDHPLSPQ